VSNILVTGGMGFIGHHLVKELISNKHKVIILDNLSNSNKDFMTECKHNEHIDRNIALYRQDIRNKAAANRIFELQPIDGCIHLCAKIDVQDSILNPHETIDVNVNGTLNILQACRENNVDNFVLASSASVYGHAQNLPIPEEHVTQPISPYGASKVAAEALVSSFRSNLKNCKILRFFNVYGKGQTPSYAGVITKFIDRLSNRLPPVIYGNGSQTRDFVHVSDVVRAIILAIEINDKKGPHIYSPNIFNIGTGKHTSVSDLAFILINIFDLNREINPVFADPIVGDIVHSYGEVERAKDVLGFESRVDLKSWLITEYMTP
jgi:UDP-glucose 4-epimerase